MGGGRFNGHNLFDQIISIENLFLAWKEFLRGKRKKPEVQHFEFNLEDNLFQLHRDLMARNYEPLPYKDFHVNDPKSRHIHKANIRDRVLHQAVFRVLYPIFDKEFIFDSYSCRFDKGVHTAVNRLAGFLRKVGRNNRRVVYALKCDVAKFFDSIDHEILLNLIERKIKDEETLWLVKKIVDSYGCEEGRGLPLGNVTSQLFANIYLHELDFFAKHILRTKYYTRYCDDFVFLGTNSDYSTMLGQIREFLERRLKLNLHSKKVIISKYSRGIDFLGYVLRPYYRILRTRTRRRLLRKINNVNAPSYLGVLSHCRGHKLKNKILDIIKPT